MVGMNALFDPSAKNLLEYRKELTEQDFNGEPPFDDFLGDAEVEAEDDEEHSRG